MSRDNEKIDIVILWVDDRDKDWLNKKNYWQSRLGLKSVGHKSERYRSWDNLHFLFRSIENNVSWANYIYLVTDGQTPEWINLSHPRLRIVDHTEIIPRTALPTFNSRAIEINVHRIKGLQDKFILMNDDIFFIRKTKKSDFFHKGLPRDSAILSLTSPILESNVNDTLINNLALINSKFSRREVIKDKPKNWYNFRYGIGNLKTLLLAPWNTFPGFWEPHTANAYTKTTFLEVWAEFEGYLNSTTNAKFRSSTNVNQWIMRWWQLVNNNFIPRNKNFSKLHNLSDRESVQHCASAIMSKQNHLICVNDTELLEDFKYAKESINKSLELLFPRKSKYEI